MRHAQWMLRLQELVDARQHARFEYGVHDCSMWACDVVLAVTGRDPADGLRGYETEVQATALMNEAGGLEALAAARFGAEVPVLCAAAGDVGLIETDRGPALVACVGAYWLGAAAFGLAQVEPGQVLRAWRCEVS